MEVDQLVLLHQETKKFCYHLGEEELILGGTELIMGPRSSSDAFSGNGMSRF